MPVTIAVADIGGTHARFALARIGEGRVLALRDAVTLKTAAFPSLPEAWQAFVATLDCGPPRQAAFAVACPVRGDVLKFTNNPWTFQQSALANELGLEKLILVNDFGAVAHAVARIDPAELIHVAGPRRPPPDTGVITIMGPGTGLGLAILARDGKTHRVIETEGGHVHFAPLDAFEERLLARMRQKYGRVSVERVVSGSGLAEIHAALPDAETLKSPPDDARLWAEAISGADPLARQALEKFCLCFGSAAGDAALIHGAEAIVLAGGLPPRFAHLLSDTGFAERLVDKGRYRALMSDLPIWMITHPQPGLFGAAAAFLAHG